MNPKAEAVLARNRIGLLLRVFATKSEDVDARIEGVVKLLAKADELKVRGKHVFSRVDIMVWDNSDYTESDCGETRVKLAERISYLVSKHTIVVSTHITTFWTGDIFCSILNSGVANQLRDRVDYTLIASTEAAEYFTEEIVGEMIGAMVEDDVMVSGVAVKELEESVMAGEIANTMALWNNQTLCEVGLFDLMAAKPKDGKAACYLHGRDSDGKDVYYQQAGVEEVIPLARLVERHGRCIAPIKSNDPKLHYQAPDPAKQPELYARHVAKMATKRVRKEMLLHRAGYDISMIHHGVHPKYRLKK